MPAGLPTYTLVTTLARGHAHDLQHVQRSITNLRGGATSSLSRSLGILHKRLKFRSSQISSLRQSSTQCFSSASHKHLMTTSPTLSPLRLKSGEWETNWGENDNVRPIQAFAQTCSLLAHASHAQHNPWNLPFPCSFVGTTLPVRHAPA